MRLWRTRTDTNEFDCRAVAKVLQSYLDGEVDAADVPAIARHLEACRDCGLAEATYDRIKVALVEPSPAQVDGAVIERLRAFAASFEADSGHDGS